MLQDILQARLFSDALQEIHIPVVQRYVGLVSRSDLAGIWVPLTQVYPFLPGLLLFLVPVALDFVDVDMLPGLLFIGE